MRASATLLIFAKAPEPGRVKTRLASHVGPLRAAQIHRELVRHSIANLSNGPWKTQLWCAPGCGHPFFQPYRQHRHLSLHRQQGGDLGQRMHHAMTAALRRSASAILIGSDCPYLTPDHIEAALDALRRGNDAVLIPARDGGYVLLGLRRPQATLFQDIPWGSPSVLTSTRARLRQARLGWQELPPLKDIDEVQDLTELLRHGTKPTTGPVLRKLAGRLHPLAC